MEQTNVCCVKFVLYWSTNKQMFRHVLLPPALPDEGVQTDMSKIQCQLGSQLSCTPPPLLWPGAALP